MASATFFYTSTLNSAPLTFFAPGPLSVKPPYWPTVLYIICRKRGRVVKAPSRDQHGHGLKPTRAVLLCPWERHFTAYSPAWWSWQAVLNYSHISIKLQADNNILVSPEIGRGNCLPYV